MYCMEQQNSILNNAAALNKPCIDYVCFYDKDVYMSYSDSDNSTDYHNGITCGVKSAIEKLIKDGGSRIQVYTNLQPYDIEEQTAEFKRIIKRIEKVAKAAGYMNFVKVQNRHNGQDGVLHEWKVLEGSFQSSESFLNEVFA